MIYPLARHLLNSGELYILLGLLKKKYILIKRVNMMVGD